MGDTTGSRLIIRGAERVPRMVNLRVFAWTPVGYDWVIDGVSPQLCDDLGTRILEEVVHDLIAHFQGRVALTPRVWVGSTVVLGLNEIRR